MTRIPSTMTSTLDRLRILIALAVLKNTPVDQTHSSYILSLRESFPTSDTPIDLWKGHARQLERECMDLRAALEKMEMRSFIDAHASSTQPTEPSESAAPPSSDTNELSTTKKKSKKKAESSTELEVVNLADVLKSGRLGLRLGRPFETMDTFLQLWTLSDRPGFPKKAFFTATRDVCKAIASSFDNATRERTNLRTLQIVQTIICTVVDKAVPLVSSWLAEHDEAVSLLFNNLLDLFMKPVVPAFLLVSERNLSYMRKKVDSSDDLGSSHASGEYVDGRVSILAVLQTTFSHIQSAVISAKDSGEQNVSALALAEFLVMIHSFILTIFRHVQDILREGDTTPKERPSRRRRIKRLAVKDTIWYLCSTVHFVLDLQDRTLRIVTLDGTKDSARQEHRLELLRHSILDIIVDLVLYQDRKRALHFTERHGYPRAKSVLRCVKSQDVSNVDSEGDVEAIRYLVLDDREYRMLFSVVERFLMSD